MSNSFDVIVIGTGTMGAATCWQLSKQQCKVLGVEQFETPHTHGSHGGQSRIIRKAYFEDPSYVPLLKRAYELWNQLEKTSGRQLYFETGIVYFGSAGTRSLQNIANSATTFAIDIDFPANDESKNRFPQFEIPIDFKTIFEKHAGLLLPELCIASFSSEAIANGATIHHHEKLIGWHLHQNGVKVVTNSAEYYCKKLIITAGAWTTKLIVDAGIHLKVTEQMLAWVQPLEPRNFQWQKFPCWFIDDPAEGMFYGFPILPAHVNGPIGIKLAHHKHGEVTDPDNRQKTSKPAEIEHIHYILHKYLPKAAGKIVNTQQCLYSNTSDEHFIIDFLPGYDDKVLVACGFSGHGFKFAPVIGEILAELALNGHSTVDIDFLRLSARRS